MTTLANPPIATFQDILYALAQNPGLAAELRRHLHDEDFLNLPQIVARAAETVEQLAATVKESAARQEKAEADSVDIKALLAQVIARQDQAEADITELKAGQHQLEAGQTRLEADITELKAGQTRLEAGQHQLESDTTELKQDVSDLKAGQTRMEADINELKAGQTRMEADITELKAGQTRLETDTTELKAGFGRLETRQSRLEGRMGTISGAEYERRIARRYRGILNRFLGMHNPKILQSIHHADSSDLDAALETAAASGAITPQDAYRLDNADIIAVGYDRDGSAVYAVIEVSETIADYDLTRAQQRAAILTTAVQVATRPVAIGKEISADNRERAAQQDVAVILLNDDDDDDPF